MNVIRASRPENVACEQQARFVEERISSVEEHLSQLCSGFGAYTNKTARLRDTNDVLCKSLRTFSENENVNKSLKHSLAELSCTLAEIGDFRDAHVQRLDKKVVRELASYNGVCRNAKEEVRNTYAVRERELSRRRLLDKLRDRNPRNRQQIKAHHREMNAESEFIKANAEVTRTQKALEEQVDVFERKKLHDLKTVLLDFVVTELSFHAKAIELFTQAYQDINQIDEEDDLEDFRDVMKMSDTTSRLETVKRASLRNSPSFLALANMFSTPPKFRRGASNAPPESPVKENSDFVESIRVPLRDSKEISPGDEDDSSSPVSEEKHDELVSRFKNVLP